MKAAQHIVPSLLWLLLCILKVPLMAQVELPVELSGEATVLGPEVLEQLADSDCKLGLNDVIGEAHGSRTEWLRASSDRFTIDRENCYWLRSQVTVPAGVSVWTSNDVLLEVGYHGLADIYLLGRDSTRQHLRVGNDLPLDERAYPHVWSKAYRNLAPIELTAGMTYDMYVKYSNLLGQTLYGTNAPLQLRLVPEQIVDKDARLHLLFSGLMMGGLLLLCLYQAAQWTVYRDALDATYVLMLLGLMSYILYDDFLLHAMFADRRISELWLYVTGSLGLMGFFRFAQITLRSVDYQARRDRVIGYLVVVKGIEVAVFLVIIGLYEQGQDWLRGVAAYVPETFRVLLIVTLLIFSYQVVRHFIVNRDKATRAFMLGNLSLVFGVLTVATRAYILPYADVAPISWWIKLISPPFDYLIEAGIVGMALCFAFAVALLTKEREAGLERNFNMQLAEARINALRSQMNPHFLFNGLNSIKSFVISNQPRAAGDYLSKFARLIRLILENSTTSLIPLSKELETLRLYLGMEQLRYGDKFHYDIDVTPTLDLGAIQVPPTLIQPYVENAIWHGLLHRKAAGGQLLITIREHSSESVRIVIEDNGVGRARAAELKAQKSTRHKSMGMHITAERIRMLEEMHGFRAHVEVDDLFDPSGMASGTRVTIDLRSTSMTLAHEPYLESAI